MAIKYGRPIETKARISPVGAPAKAEFRLDLAIRPRRNRKAEWTRRLVRENVLTARRPDLAAVRGRRHARARQSPPCLASSGSRSTKRCGRPSAPPSSASPAWRCFPTPIRSCATTTAPRRSIRKIWSAARSARSRRRCRRSASCAMLRSIPTPATATTGCCATASSSTTRRSRCWCSRRWSRPRPAPTSSRRPT